MEEQRTVTKKQLVNRLAEKTGQTKVVVKEVVQSFLDEIIDELSQGNRLEFREFGVFEVRARAARRAQNPRTLEKVEVPEKRVVRFKVGRRMRERIEDGPAPAAPAAPEAPVERPQSPEPAPPGAVAPEPTPPPPSPPSTNSPF
ncbi:MAG TPA: HU family DNA-binding protein [Planctomycetota bacterium]|jgi:integration host factor subunit beta|nr:HU family DNA-binding protein [Planctomycetota bacterium]